MNRLKIFGCVFYVQVPKTKRMKLEESSKRYILIDYSFMSK